LIWFPGLMEFLPVVLLLLAVGLALSAQAQTRVDPFDKTSDRTGSVMIGERTGRVDRYDTKSNRTGYCTTSPSGKVESLDTRGNRTGSGTITGGRIHPDLRR